jgi:UDP-N-acetylglucosamine--N-acetylmuramyl-(pentapeptide) pyrophosphoryl-undecaprenol N-acetylglucosamine transferase
LIHIAGRNHDQTIQDLYNKQLKSDQLNRLLVKGFVPDLYRYSAAADVIVTRAGATTLAEFAMQQRACIVVPNPMLTGGHQTKNAKILSAKGAIKLVSENDIKNDDSNLFNAIKRLLDFSDERTKLARTLGQLAIPDAAEKLAKLILSIAG